jgi:hypothetical protein
MVLPNLLKRSRPMVRLMLFYRRPQYNCTEQSTKWLTDCFEFHLQRIEMDFEWGVVGLSKTAIFFKSIKRQGVNVILTFWSWGDTEHEVMSNLSHVFAGMFEAARLVSQQTIETLSRNVSEA